MFCKNCGNQVTEKDKFCQNCGSLVNSNINITSEENSGNSADKKAETSGYSVSAVKKFRNITSVIVAVICIIVVFNTVDTKAIINGFKERTTGEAYRDVGKADLDLTGKLNSMLEKSKPAVEISSISFDPSIFSITYEFKNISEKDIAYINFETYFYDRMGGALSNPLSLEDSMILTYVGPLYVGDMDSAYLQSLEIPTGTSVIYPKEITVIFTDDEEINFENTVYWHSDDFYGGELKDKK